MEGHGASNSILEPGYGDNIFGRDGGLIHEVVVVGRKLGVGVKFWSELAHNSEVFEAVVKLVENGQTRACLSYKRALSMLCSKGAVPAEHAKWCWRRRPTNYGVHYSRSTIEACALDIIQGRADWRLVYLFDISLATMADEQLTSVSGHPVPFRISPPNLGTGDDGWHSSGISAEGYYLIDFEPRFIGMDLEEKRRAMDGLGASYFWPSTAAIMQALMSECTIPSPHEGGVGTPDFGLLQTRRGHVSYDSGLTNPVSLMCIPHGLGAEALLWSGIVPRDRAIETSGVCVARTWE